MTTVNGNGYYQAIHVRTEPLTHYCGYYDSLSETTSAPSGATEKLSARVTLR